MARENYPKKGMREVAFKGRLRTADPPTTIAPEDFSVLKNIRYNYGSLIGISGDQKVNNAGAVSSVDLKTGISFNKDFPVSETNTVIASQGKIYNKTTSPSLRGSFSNDITPVNMSGSGNPRMSLAPNGGLAICNGTDSLLWYGQEHSIAGFYDWDSVGDTFKHDHFERLSNSLSTDFVTLSAFPDTIDSTVKLMLHCDGTAGQQVFTDGSTSGHTVTPMGHTNTSVAQVRFGTTSASFDGTGDALSVPDSADWNFTSAGEFTIDYWIYWASTYIPQGHHFFQGTAADHINIYSTTDTITLSIYSGSSEVVKADGFLGSRVGGQSWAHIAISCEKVGSTYNYRWFLNGNLIGHTADSDGPAYGSGPLYIGYNTSSYINAAYIDEFRVCNTAKFTDLFTPPSRPYGQGSSVTSLLIASQLPIQALKFYVKTANTVATTPYVSYWSADGWKDVGTITITKSGGTAGVPLSGSWEKWAFSSTETKAKLKNQDDIILYWYKVDVAGILTTTALYHVTVDIPCQQIKDLWDGVLQPCGSFVLYDDDKNAYNNFTANVYSSEYDDANEGTFATLSSLQAADDYIYVGSTERLQGVRINLAGGKENTAASICTVEYWSGQEWVGVNATDGTIGGSGNTFGKSGTIHWVPLDPSSEFKTNVGGAAIHWVQGGDDYESWRYPFPLPPRTDEEINAQISNKLKVNSSAVYPASPVDLYFYRLSFSVNFSATVHVYNVKTIPAPVDCRGYSFPVMHDNSLFLCGNPDSEPNAVIYSAYNRPQVFNGDEAGKLFIGDNTAPVCGASFSNQFGSTDTKILLICKKSSTWRITGEAPYMVHPVSLTDGCVAPYSIAVGEVEIAQGVRRKIAVWVAQRGVVISDGTSIKELSTDVRDLFSPLHSNYIGASTLPTLHGSIDPVYNEYVLVVPGSAEWRYSFDENKWFQVDRGTAAYLSGAFPTYDATGISWMYGITNTGFAKFLDIGTRFDTTTSTNNITYTLRLADIALYNSSIMYKSKINWSSLVLKTKSSATTPAVTTTYFVDGNNTGTTIDTADPKESGYSYVNRELHGQAKTGTFHSPQFTITTEYESIGFEPVMWGCEYTVIPREK